MATAKKQFDFKNLGARLGEVAAAAIKRTAEAGSELTVAEMFELGSRPFRKVCLLCGEPQDPPGAMLGVNCKNRIRQAGMFTALRAGESIQNLTMADLVEIYKAAKEAGFLRSDADASDPPDAHDAGDNATPPPPEPKRPTGPQKKR